jgi:hypothetical protein
MKPTWLVEAGVYGEEAKPLLTEIRRQGMQAEFVPYKSLQKGQILAIGGETLPEDACVIGYGTFPFARQIQLHRRWVLGSWANPDNLDCTTYFAYFGKFLLNQQYAVMPDDTVFVRPTRCDKLFTGRLISKESFATGLAPTRYDPTTLVVVAAPKNIHLEWRLVVVGDRVIAGSQYAEERRKVLKPGVPEAVRTFVEAMLTEVRWTPDRIFMMDVGEADGQLSLIELNGFSCSWLYQRDLPVVVSQASEVAAQAWEGNAE